MNVYSIGAVAQRTGLTPPVIRMWESRYGAVCPERSDSGQRRYSDDDVRRLQKLKLLTDAGHRIGLVAGLDERELDARVSEMQRPTFRLIESPADSGLAGSIEAVRDMDRDRFRSELDRASLRMGSIEMLERFLGPLMQEIGNRCAAGQLRIVHEHMATAELRGFLDGVSSAFPSSPGSPSIVVGTPAWQHHELGALIVGAIARAEGWNVTYLGPNLPASELAMAAIEVSATAIALSITFVDDQAQLARELETIARLLPEDVSLLVGGRGASDVRGLLDELGATHVEDLTRLRRELSELRASRLAS